MQIVDEVIHATADDIITAAQLIHEVMTAWTIELAEAQYARFRETRSQHGLFSAENRIRRRRTAHGRSLVDLTAIILSIHARGAGENKAVRTDVASPRERALHTDVVS